MAIKGKMMWVPGFVLDELEDIIREYDLTGKNVRGRAFVKMTMYTRVGREIDRIRHLSWSKKKQPPPEFAQLNKLYPVEKKEKIETKKYKVQNPVRCPS